MSDNPNSEGRSPEASRRLVTNWRIVGWVVAILMIVVVAGPQIIDLF
ncbi:hypothetical protein C3B54_111139 [Pontimonas salivibrio]|uniref:Uncharacterized protein n=1 Tax=Pontimonas salivibrio TaxID=1159327 RepID=A0A2L2BR09_9MICO|nr:hypothetical protein [Pontimonas salivibrio]AVG24100.1 hypothetical protein C3B54_111139 [Pontimonas salivibrio]